MNDLISRRDAIDTHCAICPVKDKCPDGDFICPDRELFRMIKPACPEQQKIGEWVEDVAYYDEDGCPCIITRCNRCGEPNPVSNFCPNCGACMQAKMGVKD
jgi:hypothetical protein